MAFSSALYSQPISVNNRHFPRTEPTTYSRHAKNLIGVIYLWQCTGCDYNEVYHPADDSPADYHSNKAFDSSLLAQALPFLSLDEVFIFGLEGRVYSGSGILEFCRRKSCQSNEHEKHI